MSNLKKRYWAVKVVAYTSIWLGKRESDLYWNEWCPKSQRLTHKMKYKKFQATISKRDVKIKNDQMLWIVRKPNEKLQWYITIFLWEIIYVHFYNWDRPLDLVPVVYDLIELIIESSLWTKDYSTFNTYTQHIRLLFNECLFHLCDCTCSNVMCILNCLSIKPKFFFEHFICFWKCFYAFVFWVFVQIVFFMFFIKNSFWGIFARSTRLSSSHENGLRQNNENTKFRQKLS